MGLFQKAAETYDAHLSYVGVEREGHQTLAPVAHILTRAELEITLNQDGTFSSARLVDKSEPKIPIPATEDSAGRTSGACAHPLCDQLCYLAPCDEKKHRLYVEQLTAWAESGHSHPMLQPILNYVKGGSILTDLREQGLITLDREGKPTKEKLLVRWRVHGMGAKNGCWQQPSLFRAFQDWYVSLQTQDSQALCMISGAHVLPAKQHLKGIIPANGNAKLISANDQSGFTYRGRFTEDSQAATVSYLASQKAHNALQWIAAEQGAQAVFGGRTFLCWIPQGIQICHAAGPFGNRNQVITKPSAYRRALKATLEGYQSQLPDKNASVVVAAFDAATTGRLALTYYNELMGSDYLQRLCDWDDWCCWYGKGSQIQSPPLWQIINCAFGTQLEEKGKIRLRTGDKVMGQQMQRLISCRVDRAHMPLDLVKALFDRASTPLAYDSSIRGVILSTACAVIRKYRHDVCKEECEMSLNPEKTDRSYQFGRLLAVLEKAERDTYGPEETREPNAIRMQSVFSRRPMYAAKIIEEQLERAYFPRVKSGSRSFYRNLIGQIMEQISCTPEAHWNDPLGETYLMGYYLQRNALYQSRKNNKEEENENEHSAEQD